MIPIRDINPKKKIPFVNNALIVLNIFVYFTQMAQGDDLSRFMFYYGLVPARYSAGEIAAYFSTGQQLFSFVSFMFLHGGFFHILFNMWTLWIFGDNVEEHMGPFRYLAFYLLCGVLSGITHLLFNIHSNVPVVGASGAIAGVMGAYLILFPNAKVLTLFPLFFIPFFFELPAFVFIGAWFFLQFVNAVGSIGGMTNIAWWAHIGGFLFGIALLKLFDQVPKTGVTRSAEKLLERKTTHKLQLIRPGGSPEDSNLYGQIVVTSFEAQRGAQKMVNIPWGFHDRVFGVWIPPGTREGNVLRLNGLGRMTADGTRGDMMLTVKFEAY